MKRLVVALLLCAGAAFGATSGGIPPSPQKVLFANLGTPQDSNWRFCVDCATTAPCTGSGSGAFAYRVGAAWNCNTGVAGGSGTVTSVAATVPAFMAIGGSPITTSGTLAFSFASQAQNLVLVSPNGSSGVPSFRALVAADLPATAVTPGAYTSSNITVDQQGRITAAASGSAGGANTALSNLSAVAVNIDILPGTDKTIVLGSSAFRWKSLFLNGDTGQIGIRFSTVNGDNVISYPDGIGLRLFDETAFVSWTLAGLPALTTSRTVTVPDASGTMALTSSNVATATALAANPTDCSAGQYATTIAANGNLTCANPFASHVVTSGTTPSVSSCGASPSIVGNDSAGRVTVGSGVTTTCTITFASLWTTAPVCHAENETTILLVQPQPTTTALVLNSGSALTSNVIAYSCRGY